MLYLIRLRCLLNQAVSKSKKNAPEILSKPGVLEANYSSTHNFSDADPVTAKQSIIAVVQKSIYPGKLGQVKFQGTRWKACNDDRSVTIAAGDKVRVLGRRASILVVEPLIAPQTQVTSAPASDKGSSIAPQTQVTSAPASDKGSLIAPQTQVTSAPASDKGTVTASKLKAEKFAAIHESLDISDLRIEKTQNETQKLRIANRKSLASLGDEVSKLEGLD